MGDATRPLVLGSNSPRRRDLLAEAGFDFEVDVPDVDERALPGESAEAQARRLALEK
ncbi:MAG: Maf family protein, partial [Myxococcota bacterium]